MMDATPPDAPAHVIVAPEAELAAACTEGLEPNIVRWLRFADVHAGDVVELQMLDVPTDKGAPASWFAHAKNLGAIVRLLGEPLTKRANAVYQILNRVDPRIANRDTPNTWHRAKKSASTTDRDIVERVVLPVDLDVERPRGTSASDAELARAVVRAEVVYAHLVALVGKDALAFGHSGNGRWIAIALARLPETKELNGLVRDVLAALAALHDAPPVHVDAACSDAKRLGPAWGTQKRKGSATPETPHRMTGVVVPPKVRRLSLEDLQALRDTLVALAPQTAVGKRAAPATPRSTRDAAGPSLFELANGIAVAHVVAELGLVDGNGVRCPKCGAGGNGDTSVALLGNILKCSHATCSDIGPNKGGVRTVVDLWTEVRGGTPREGAIALCEHFGVPIPAKVKKPRLTKAEKAAAAAAEGVGERTELEIAKLFVLRYGNVVRYCAALGGWFAWTGTHWKLDVLEQCREYMKAIAEELAVEALTNEKAFKSAKRAGSAAGVEAVLSLVRSTPGIIFAPGDANKDPWLLNCTSGTINLRTGLQRPHDPADLMTRCSPAAFDLDAKCPRFDRFLAEIQPDPEVRAYLARLFGYSSVGLVREHALAVCWGTGANGKSVLLLAVSHVLGDYAKPGPASLVVANGNHTPHPTDVAACVGSRLVVVHETARGATFDASKVKILTGGDDLTARHMREDFFAFKPSHTLVMLSNYRPVADATDAALWRRVQLVPFEVVIPEERRDGELAERLRSEASGILRWIVEGAREWQRLGLSPPAVVREQTEAYRTSEDTIGAFLEECTMRVPDHRQPAGALYTAFTSWCRAQGAQACRGNDFSTELVLRGFRREEKSAGNFYIGIGLSSQQDDSERYGS